MSATFTVSLTCSNPDCEQEQWESLAVPMPDDPRQLDVMDEFCPGCDRLGDIR